MATNLCAGDFCNLCGLSLGSVHFQFNARRIQMGDSNRGLGHGLGQLCIRDSDIFNGHVNHLYAALVKHVARKCLQKDVMHMLLEGAGLVTASLSLGRSGAVGGGGTVK